MVDFCPTECAVDLQLFDCSVVVGGLSLFRQILQCILGYRVVGGGQESTVPLVGECVLSAQITSALVTSLENTTISVLLGSARNRTRYNGTIALNLL